jgi:hypothetical protein
MAARCLQVLWTLEEAVREQSRILTSSLHEKDELLHQVWHRRGTLTT